MHSLTRSRAHIFFCAGFSDARQGDAGDARRMVASEKPAHKRTSLSVRNGGP
jgi:hypothetical protein